MQVFGCIGMFLLAGVLMVLAAILVLIQKVLALFGIQLPWFKFIKTGNFGNPYDFGGQQSSAQQSSGTTYTTGEQIEKKKVYTEDDGEYVEFEEVKDE